jgi:hypothetical protein
MAVWLVATKAAQKAAQTAALLVVMRVASRDEKWADPMAASLVAMKAALTVD